MKDREFVSYFGAVLAILVLVTVILFVIANVLSAGYGTMDLAMIKETNARIAPVGQVNIGNVPAVQPQPVPAEQTSEGQTSVAMSSEIVYQSACQACHLSGVLQSPKLTDKAAWETRMQRGIDALYQSVLQGRGSMPPKGGRMDLSDETIKGTVDYMLEKAGVLPR